MELVVGLFQGDRGSAPSRGVGAAPELVPDLGVEGSRNASMPVGRHVHAGRLPVPPNRSEVPAHPPKGLVEVDPGNGAGASPPPAAVERHEHHGPMDPFHDSGGHDPDDPGVPPLARQDHAVVAGRVEAAGPGGPAPRPACGDPRPAAPRWLVEFPAKRQRLVRSSARSRRSAVSAAPMRPMALIRGARTKPTCPASTGPRKARHLFERPEPRHVRVLEEAEPELHEHPVLPLERNQVRHRGRAPRAPEGVEFPFVDAPGAPPGAGRACRPRPLRTASPRGRSSPPRRVDDRQAGGSVSPGVWWSVTITSIPLVAASHGLVGHDPGVARHEKGGPRRPGGGHAGGPRS
jgi:hypothetical protein